MKEFRKIDTKFQTRQAIAFTLKFGGKLSLNFNGLILLIKNIRAATNSIIE